MEALPSFLREKGRCLYPLSSILREEGGEGSPSSPLLLREKGGVQKRGEGCSFFIERRKEVENPSSPCLRRVEKVSPSPRLREK